MMSRRSGQEGALCLLSSHMPVTRGHDRRRRAQPGWPAHVQIDAHDLPALARLLARPAAMTAAATVIVTGLAGLAARRRTRR